MRYGEIWGRAAERAHAAGGPAEASEAEVAQLDLGRCGGDVGEILGGYGGDVAKPKSHRLIWAGVGVRARG